jgi:uncharacterized protein (DUF736 family)
MENKTQNKNQNELGALWKKKSKTGLSFLSGYINDHDGQRIDVVVFANSKKTNEKAPDYRLYVSKPLDKASSEPVAQKPAQEVKKFVKKQVSSVVEEDEDIL